mmetsp:Transcript_83416/g.193880  ORF Transcript_83416/g.193880 Transcript_83416/m.193880 type:complete len:206 (-) Transcript_83416:154-771(-)
MLQRRQAHFVLHLLELALKGLWCAQLDGQHPASSIPWRILAKVHSAETLVNNLDLVHVPFHEVFPGHFLDGHFIFRWLSCVVHVQHERGHTSGQTQGLPVHLHLRYLRGTATARRLLFTTSLLALILTRLLGSHPGLGLLLGALCGSRLCWPAAAFLLLRLCTLCLVCLLRIPHRYAVEALEALGRCFLPSTTLSTAKARVMTAS